MTRIDALPYPRDSSLWGTDARPAGSGGGMWTKTFTIACDSCPTVMAVTTQQTDCSDDAAYAQMLDKINAEGWSSGDGGEHCPRCTRAAASVMTTPVSPPEGTTPDHPTLDHPGNDHPVETTPTETIPGDHPGEGHHPVDGPPAPDQDPTQTR